MTRVCAPHIGWNSSKSSLITETKSTVLMPIKTKYCIHLINGVSFSQSL